MHQQSTESSKRPAALTCEPLVLAPALAMESTPTQERKERCLSSQCVDIPPEQTFGGTRALVLACKADAVVSSMQQAGEMLLQLCLIAVLAHACSTAVLQPARPVVLCASHQEQLPAVAMAHTCG